MTITLCIVSGLLLVALGVHLGICLSRAVFEQMVDHGQIVFKVAEGGWEGTLEALQNLKLWLARQ